MAEVVFYHLTETPLERALPPLLEKSLERGWRVRVRGSDAERLDFLDRHLWTMDDASFLPHGRAGADHDTAQPILLTDKAENTNAANILMLIDGAEEPSDSYSSYDRVCLLFDGHDPEAVSATRSSWSALKDQGHNCKYWAQEGGRWVEKGAS